MNDLETEKTNNPKIAPFVDVATLNAKTAAIKMEIAMDMKMFRRYICP